uniref:Uncharacterized protein n=1 Tax=Prolemur simus TaxID=1328070 RepID=A0A8C8YCC7_PROSS
GQDRAEGRRLTALQTSAPWPDTCHSGHMGTDLLWDLRPGRAQGIQLPRGHPAFRTKGSRCWSVCLSSVRTRHCPKGQATAVLCSHQVTRASLASAHSLSPGGLATPQVQQASQCDGRHVCASSEPVQVPAVLLVDPYPAPPGGLVSAARTPSPCGSCWYRG